MAPEQRSAILRASSSPAAGGAQLFGALLGLGALVVGIQALTGNTALDPTSFTVFAIGLAVAALVLAGVAKGVRSEYALAVRAGRVYDLRGVPEPPAPDGSIALGGVRLRANPVWSNLRPNQANRVVYALKGIPRGREQPILVVGVNDLQLSKAMIARLEVAA